MIKYRWSIPKKNSSACILHLKYFSIHRFIGSRHWGIGISKWWIHVHIGYNMVSIGRN